MSRRLLELVRRFGFLALLLVFVSLLGGGLAYYLLRLERAELAAHAQIGALYARNFEEQVTQSLNLVDLTLRNTGEAAASDPQRLAQRLREALRGAPLLRSLSLLGDDGRIEVSTNATNLGVFVADTGFLPPAHGGPAQLRIGSRWAGRDFGDGGDSSAGGVYLIPVRREVDFAGRRRVLLAALNPDYFINQFSVRLQGESAVALVARFDGLPLLSTQADDPLLRELGTLPFWARLGETGSGGLDWASADGRRWLLSFRASRDHPLLILTRIDRERAVAGWHDEARQLLLIVLPALFGLLALAVALYAAQRREALRHEREAGETAERQRLAILFDALPANLLLLDDRGHVQLCNGEWERFLGRVGVDDEGVGTNFLALCASVFAGGDDPTLTAGLAAILDGSKELFVYEVKVRADGQLRWLQMLLRPLHAEHLQGAVALLVDISERKANEERIRFLSEHDFLTGLPNRGLLEDRLAQMIVSAERFGGRLALLFVDLDRFKSINDTLGHPIGDLLLREVALRIGGCVRASDTVSRQGGDEFLVLLREIDSPADAARVAEKLIDSIGAPCRLDGNEVTTSASIGIALYPDDGTTMSALIRNADSAMYRSKELGRNRFSFFTSAMNKTALERRLRRALAQRELALRFQPLVELASGRLVGAQAQLCWHSDELGAVAPECFVAVAGETGLMRDIGDWAIGELCRQGVAWRRDGSPPLTLALKVSAVQAAQKGFVGRVRLILEQTGFAGSELELSLSESVLIDSPAARDAVFEGLRSLGIVLAIDGFGGGCSSLANLRCLPIDKLKIDRSYSRDLADASIDATITGTIIRMARQMRLRVVAEGVDDPAQLAFLRVHGCDEIQGLLVSPPLSASDFAAFVAAWRARAPAPL